MNGHLTIVIARDPGILHNGDMRRRGWIAGAGAVAVVVAISGFTIRHDNQELAVKPSAVAGTVVLQVVRNTNPQTKQFLNDVQVGDDAWLSMPGTFVEAHVHWQLPRRLHSGACEVVVHLLPDAPMRVGAQSTGTTGSVAMSGDVVVQRALNIPGSPYARDAVSYMVDPTDTEGTITFLVAYPDYIKARFGGSPVYGSAVVECDNHDYLFGHERYVTGPVSTLAVQTS